MTRSVNALYGVDLAVEEFGAGDPVLLLHSEEGPELSRPFASAVSAGAGRVLMPHHPGFGSTDRLAWPATVRDLAYLYHEFLEVNGYSDVQVIGTSLGAWIALELAAMGSGPISRADLIAPVGVKVGDREQRDFVDVFAISENERASRGYHDPAVAELDVSQHTEAELEVMARNRETFTLYAWEPYLHSTALRHHVQRIRIPVHIVRGDSDRLVRDGYYDELATVLPTSRTTVISQAGHFPDVERPQQTAQAVLERTSSDAAVAAH